MSLATLLTSCLEDTGYLNIFNGENSQPVVSFGQADHGQIVRTVEVSTEPQELSVNINIARATSDVTVTVAMDPSLLDEYNESRADEAGFEPYSLLPDSTYTIPSFTINIPKGTLDGAFTFSVVSSKISLDEQYILPLLITTTTGGATIASNLNTSLIVVGVKNDYDGIYDVIDGNIQRNSATGPDPLLSGDFVDGIEIEVITASVNSNFFAPTWKDGSGIGGIDNTYLTVNKATNEVTVLSKNNASLKNTSGRINSYDPATKTFTLNFDWGAAPSTRVITDYKLKYKKPRP